MANSHTVRKVVISLFHYCCLYAAAYVTPTLMMASLTSKNLKQTTMSWQALIVRHALCCLGLCLWEFNLSQTRFVESTITPTCIYSISQSIHSAKPATRNHQGTSTCLVLRAPSLTFFEDKSPPRNVKDIIIAAHDRAVAPGEETLGVAWWNCYKRAQVDATVADLL